MKLHLQNRATHWEGDRLVLKWRVVSEAGNPLSRWASRDNAINTIDRMYRYNPQLIDLFVVR